MSFFSLLLILFSSAVLSGSVAADKGHNRTLWTLAGLFFGPFGLIASVGQSDLTLRRYIRGLQEEKLLKETPNSVAFAARTLGEFSLSKDASQDQVWERILDSLGPELATMADKSKSLFSNSTYGTPQVSVSKSNGQPLAFAYFKGVKRLSSLEHLWQIELE